MKLSLYLLQTTLDREISYIVTHQA